MPRLCKLCDTEDKAFELHPEVCDDCVRYDWGHWRWRQVSWVGGMLGFFVGVGLTLWNAGASYTSPYAAAFFTGLIGALAGWAVTEVIVDRLLNRALIHSPPNEAPHERAREAEKFFYIGVLSAYQGKTRFAARMLAVAHVHGWHRWEELARDPRLPATARRALVRAVTQR